jgi:hypothetical protein
MESITLAEQKSEKVPRISGQDLIELLGLQVAYFLLREAQTQNALYHLLNFKVILFKLG